MEEDILYQRGASFSAKLDDSNAHIFDNTLISKDKGRQTKGDKSQTHKINTVTGSDTGQSGEQSDSGGFATLSNEMSDDGFYSKDDMSIYDDVNNNRLNLRSRDSMMYGMMAPVVETSDPSTVTPSSNIKNQHNDHQNKNSTDKAPTISR